MKDRNKRAFLEFFLIYFLSVAVLILCLGIFYYIQVKVQLLKNEQFSLIEYARAVKTGNGLDNFSDEYGYSVPIKFKKRINIKNFNIIDDKFIKYIPLNKYDKYFKVFKSTKNYEKTLFELKKRIIFFQIILLMLFGIISYYLAKNAIKPLKKSIETLDGFAKDLIHDLNTPTTSLKLNLNLLKREECLKDSKVVARLQKSVSSISELHENLTILLQEGTFQFINIEIFDIVDEIVQIQKEIYPDINFIVKKERFIVKTNPKAMKQILQNIISNGCKYNKKDGFLKIYKKDKSLCIEDSGTGIKEPEKIFERSFSEKGSSGIGLDIVKRLADGLNIKIDIISNSSGSIFVLKLSIK